MFDFQFKIFLFIHLVNTKIKKINSVIQKIIFILSTVF